MNFKDAAKDAMISEDVIQGVAKEVLSSDRLMKLINVLVSNLASHHVQVKLASELLLHIQETLLTGEGETVFRRQHSM